MFEHDVYKINIRANKIIQIVYHLIPLMIQDKFIIIVLL